MANMNKNLIRDDRDVDRKPSGSRKGKDRDNGNKRKTRNGRKPPHSKETELKEDKDLRDPNAAYNEIGYYIPPQDKQLLVDVSQLSFQTINGVSSYGTKKAPTIMQIYMNPSPGLTFQGANPGLNHPLVAGVNMAGIKLFNLLSMSSGRNMAYAPQDVMTAVLGMSQLYAMHSYVRRLFQSVNIWNLYNREFPKYMIEAMGIDYEDFVSNYSDYRSRFNALIASMNQLPMIANMGFLRKSLTQYSFIFADSESPLAQTYVYLPRTTWILDETSYSGGTILKTTTVCTPQTTRTFADLMVNVLRPMVDALLQSSTLNLVYADILNYALKGSEFKFITLPFIMDGEATIPIHNYEALMHIHNMTFMDCDPSVPTLGSRTTPLNDVYPDPTNNMLWYNPGYPKSLVVGATGVTPPHRAIIDAPEASPSDDVRVELSRYISMYTQNGETIAGVDYMNFVVVPDYVPIWCYIVFDDPANSELVKTRWVSGSAGAPWITASWDITQFDWHPIIRSFDSTTGMYDQVIGDLNYWTTTDVNYLEKINEILYLGMFTLQ